MKRYRVIRSRSSDYPEPIRLERGDIVILGEVFTGHGNWPDWIRCSREGVSGWVPRQIIEPLDEGRGRAGENYLARELDVEAGELLLSERELNGWIWCCREQDEDDKGWVPLENLELLTV